MTPIAPSALYARHIAIRRKDFETFHNLIGDRDECGFNSDAGPGSLRLPDHSRRLLPAACGIGETIDARDI